MQHPKKVFVLGFLFLLNCSHAFVFADVVSGTPSVIATLFHHLHAHDHGSDVVRAKKQVQTDLASPERMKEDVINNVDDDRRHQMMSPSSGLFPCWRALRTWYHLLVQIARVL